MAASAGFPDLLSLLRSRFSPPPVLWSLYELYGRLSRARGYRLAVESFGARSTHLVPREVTLAELTRRAATPPLKGTYLYLFVQRQRPMRLLELGTHLGIGTLYLYAAVPTAEIHTVEASPTLFTYAKRHFALFGARIKCHLGCFEEVLPTLAGPWDLIYIDGNHQGEALQAYIAQLYPHLRAGGWFVCDDIYWSWDMYRAWQRLRRRNWRVVRVVYPFGFLQK